LPPNKNNQKVVEEQAVKISLSNLKVAVICTVQQYPNVAMFQIETKFCLSKTN